MIAPPRDKREARIRRASPREILLVADWEDAKKINNHREAAGWTVERFVPNNEAARGKLLALVKDGDERPAPPATNQ